MVPAVALSCSPVDKRSDGMCSNLPTTEEGGVLQAAINISVIDSAMTVPKVSVARMITTDNTEMQAWPISQNGDVAYLTGNMIKTTSGGWNLDRGIWKIPCPLELYMPRMICGLDAELGQAVYDVTMKVKPTNSF